LQIPQDTYEMYAQITKDEDKRDFFVEAVKATLVKRMTGGVLNKTQITRPEMLYFKKERTLNSAYAKVHKILYEKRNPAWALVRNSMRSLATDGNFYLGDKKFSLNRNIELMYPEGSDSYENHNSKNAYKRVWTPSKPVVHLVQGLVHNKLFKEIPSLEEAIFKPDWLPEALQSAEDMRKIICLMPNLKIKDKDTIQLLAK